MIDHAATVIKRQRSAQARADAMAAEQKRVRAFLRMALPENAILREPKKTTPVFQSSSKRPGAKFDSGNSLKSFGVTIGSDYVPSACKCVPWDDCYCGQRQKTAKK